MYTHTHTHTHTHTLTCIRHTNKLHILRICFDTAKLLKQTYKNDSLCWGNGMPMPRKRSRMVHTHHHVPVCLFHCQKKQACISQIRVFVLCIDSALIYINMTHLWFNNWHGVKQQSTNFINIHFFQNFKICVNICVWKSVNIFMQWWINACQW